MYRSFMWFPGGFKPPMDTYLYACGREVNQNPVTMPGLKPRQGVMLCAPK